MAFERTWAPVPPRFFTLDGGTLGQVQIANTRGFKVKQHVVIAAVGQPNLILEVKRVLSSTLLFVGNIGDPITKRIDISAYTTAASAYIYAEEQSKAKLTREDREYAVYEQEPTVAKRVILVDQLGEFYESSNPLPVTPVENVVLLAPSIANFSMPNANQEYSFTFPDKTIKFLMKIRGGYAKTQFSYISGQSGTNYMTLSMGNFYKEDTNVSNKTIYMQTNKPNQIMEIIYWVSP
jgi:hypothetical protein